LVLQAAPQWPLVAVRQQLARSIDVVVHVDRIRGDRQVSTICEVVEPALDGQLDAPAIRPLGEIRSGRFVELAPLERSRR
jgi:pilus assembly protein CpaF